MDYFVLAGTRNKYVLVNLLHIVSAVQQNVVGGCILHLTNGQTIHVESSVDDVHGSMFEFYADEEDEDDDEGEWDEELAERIYARTKDAPDLITTQFVEQYKANVAMMTSPEALERMRAEREDRERAHREHLVKSCDMTDADIDNCMKFMERILSPENIPRPKGFE